MLSMKNERYMIEDLDHNKVLYRKEYKEVLEVVRDFLSMYGRTEMRVTDMQAGTWVEYKL
jgi:hypothetical protein